MRMGLRVTGPPAAACPRTDARFFAGLMVNQASTIQRYVIGHCMMDVAVTDRPLKGIAAALLVAVSIGTIGLMISQVGRLAAALVPHDLRLVPLGLTANPPDPPPITLEVWHAAPVLPQPNTLLLRLVSDERGTPADESISNFKRLLGAMGFIKNLVDEVAAASGGEGGPYIALGDGRAMRLDSEKLRELKRLAANLPLGIPLTTYELSSGFGPRIDPIDHDPAFHPGIDMAAPYRSDVYGTGAGKVIFAGSMDGYGRVVEIDHGSGVVTRYAHLHRILVAKGETVRSHTVIGEVGSTGRSTGPHLHYEIRVGGAVIDPAQFIILGDAAAPILHSAASEGQNLNPRDRDPHGAPSPAQVTPDIAGFDLR